MPSGKQRPSQNAKHFAIVDDLRRAQASLRANFQLIKRTKFKHLRSSQLKRRYMNKNKEKHFESLLGLTDEEAFNRKREWNREPLKDLFPRIPEQALERILDIAISKNLTYNLSESKRWTARRLTSIVVAHIRHTRTDYDKLLREDHVERYDARKRTGADVWKILKEWCPWDADNDVLEDCFRVTLLRPEEREPEWDPMDIDSDLETEPEATKMEYADDDPMDLD